MTLKRTFEGRDIFFYYDYSVGMYHVCYLGEFYYSQERPHTDQDVEIIENEIDIVREDIRRMQHEILANVLADILSPLL